MAKRGLSFVRLCAQVLFSAYLAGAMLAEVTAADPQLPDPAAVELKVSPTLKPDRDPSAIVFYLSKSEGKWRASESSDLAKPGVEQIQVNLDSGEIHLMANPPAEVSKGERARGNGSGNRWECFAGWGTNAARSFRQYNVCASVFATSNTGVGESVIGGLNLLFGTVRRFVVIDTKAIVDAAQEAGLLALVVESRDRRNAAWLDAYRAQFRNAQSLSDWTAFLRTAARADPDGLIPEVNSRLATLEKEAMERKEAEVARLELERQERAKRLQEQKKLDEAEAARAELARQAWVKQLKIGDETFCGPVIEVRQPMIKIAVSAQLAGFASEAWLRDREVFMPMEGCSNVNGRLQPLSRRGR
jgi:hypothetical protein